MVKKQKNKRQVAKSQKRKKIVKKRVIARRAKHREEAKENREIERLEWKYRERQTPLRKAKEDQDGGVTKLLKDVNDTPAEKDKKIVDKLKHNLEILKALEDQYFSEESEREELNQEFLDAGLVTMEEKMEYLKEKSKKEYEEKSLTDPTNYPPMPSDNVKPVVAKMKQVDDGVGEVVDIKYEKIDKSDDEKSIEKEPKGGD